jgi:hypothetical protein
LNIKTQGILGVKILYSLNKLIAYREDVPKDHIKFGLEKCHMTILERM